MPIASSSMTLNELPITENKDTSSSNELKPMFKGIPLQTETSSTSTNSIQSILRSQLTKDEQEKLIQEIQQLQKERKSLRDSFFEQRQAYLDALKTQEKIRNKLNFSESECEKLETEIQCLIDLILEFQPELKPPDYLNC